MAALAPFQAHHPPSRPMTHPRHRIARVLALLTAVLAWTLPAQAQAADPLRGLDAYIEGAMRDWEVPGMAVAIVLGHDSVIYARGFGVRQAGPARAGGREHGVRRGLEHQGRDRHRAGYAGERGEAALERPGHEVPALPATARRLGHARIDGEGPAGPPHGLRHLAGRPAVVRQRYRPIHDVLTGYRSLGSPPAASAANTATTTSCSWRAARSSRRGRAEAPGPTSCAAASSRRWG